MAEIKITKTEQGQTKIRTVPVAVTPEGFWCCPSPVAFQKTLNKSHNSLHNKPKHSPSPPQKPSEKEKKPSSTTIRSVIASDEQQQQQQQQQSNNNPEETHHHHSIAVPVPVTVVQERPQRQQKVETLPRKVAIEFGEAGSSDAKVILVGKQGFCVKLSVHKKVLVDHSGFFAKKLAERDSVFACLEIESCEDAEIYVETVGLMYCKDVKQRLMKQNVSRVLRVLKVAELLGFSSCIQSCLDYLEAVPWVGEEEEEKVISSILRLKTEGVGVVTTPVLKRVASSSVDPPKETLSRIIELVLRSKEEKSRREMKSIVLKLLREQNGNNVADNFNETIYSSCQSCLDSVLSMFRQQAEADAKQIGVEADNLTWLLDVLAERQAAEEFSVTWANQKELALLHEKLPLVSRYHISRVTSRLFVGIGRGEMLPSKDTRLLLLTTWLQPLFKDYNWLQHGCRSFDGKLVEEGIGRTILTLPLEDQQRILMSWLGSFLNGGDGCPNLQRAFEVWWRRSFVRPYSDRQGSGVSQTDSTSKE